MLKLRRNPRSDMDAAAMSSAHDQAVTGYQPGSPRQRLISSLLSAAIVLIALLIAIYQTAVAPQLKKRAQNPVTFAIKGEDADSGSKSAERHKQAPKEEKDLPKQSEVKVAAPVPPVEKPTDAEKPAFSFLKMSRSDMAAADIGAMQRAGSGDPAPAKGKSGSTYGPGEGPGGAVLRMADWYRPPTDAEVNAYLPAKMPPSGSGLIACQTAEHYHVENCQILNESPRGSGLGRAVLNASWQFLVRPSSVNGKPEIGDWVSIRITWSQEGGLKFAGT